MKQSFSFLMNLVLWGLLASTSFAEVSVHGQGLTANLDHASLSRVLMKICEQADMDITIVDGSEYHKAIVSDVFDDVPLEQGLDRLLNGWNYGLIKSARTGALQTLIVLSRRTGVVERPSVETHVQVISNRLEEEDPDNVSEAVKTPEFASEKKIQTEEDLLNSAPPQVRGLIARMLGRDGEG